MPFISFRVIIKRIQAIKFMLKDPNVKKRKKLLVILGLVYLAMPIDLIPVVIFPIGFIDDIVLWLWILYHLRETLDTYWLGEKTVDLSKEYKGKTIIDDVEFEVKEEYSKTFKR
jgi:uncharacterized membrane protein YkvA (DUF1232 family)